MTAATFTAEIPPSLSPTRHPDGPATILTPEQTEDLARGLSQLAPPGLYRVGSYFGIVAAIRMLDGAISSVLSPQIVAMLQTTTDGIDESEIPGIVEAIEEDAQNSFILGALSRFGLKLNRGEDDSGIKRNLIELMVRLIRRSLERGSSIFQALEEYKAEAGLA